MENEFVSYEIALALKELGFDEPCMAQWNGSKGFDGFGGNYRNSYFNYSDQIAAPTFSQAFRWFREKYGIFSSIWCFETEQKFFIEFGFGIQKFEVNNKEEAELECLNKLIEIVKQ